MILLLLACQDPEFDPTLGAAFQDALDKSTRLVDAPGASAAVYVPEKGLWLGVSGDANLDPVVPMSTDNLLRIGSITKTFVGTVILQLAEEGSLSLDDPLDIYLPEVPHAAEVTLRQLMNHTAGYADYVETLTFLGSLNQHRSPEQLIALIADEPLRFTPGTGFAYSNTHFVLLGMVIEQVTRSDYQTQVHDRLLDHNNLKHTLLPTVDSLTGTLAHGYVGDPPLDVTDDIDPSGPWAAGEMLAPANELVMWAQALYGGGELDSASLAEMTTPTTLPDGSLLDYGLACYVQEVGGAVTWGHSGSTHGYQSRLRYRPDDGAVVVVLVNSYFSEADTIDASLWELLP